MYRLGLLIGWLLVLFGVVSTCPKASITERSVHAVVLKMDDAQEPMNIGVRSLSWAEFSKPESDPSPVIHESRAGMVDAPLRAPSQAMMVAPSDTPLGKRKSTGPRIDEAIGVFPESLSRG